MEIFSKFINFRDNLFYNSLIVLLFIIITIFLFWVSPWLLCEVLFACQEIKFNIPDTILDSLFLLLIVFLLMVVVRGYEVFKQYRKRAGSTYTLNTNSWPNGWIYSGRPEVIGGELHVKSSRAGLLLEEKVWKNCEISFDMKFDKELYKSEIMGVIFRARDLDNYFMLEIRGKLRDGKEWGEGNSLAPHIRYKSGWQAAGLNMFHEFDFTSFKSVKVKVKDNLMTFFYEGTSIFDWILPPFADISHFESGVEDKKNSESASLTKNLSGNHVQIIPFRLDHGMIGFRAHYDQQGAIVRNLEVKPI